MPRRERGDWPCPAAMKATAEAVSSAGLPVRDRRPRPARQIGSRSMPWLSAKRGGTRTGAAGARRALAGPVSAPPVPARGDRRRGVAPPHLHPQREPGGLGSPGHGGAHLGMAGLRGRRVMLASAPSWPRGRRPQLPVAGGDLLAALHRRLAGDQALVVRSISSRSLRSCSLAALAWPITSSSWRTVAPRSSHSRSRSTGPWLEPTALSRARG